jgi:hypothetical protein
MLIGDVPLRFLPAVLLFLFRRMVLPFVAPWDRPF